MKKIKSLNFLILLVTIFVSCSKNEKADITVEPVSIIGIWRPIKIVTVCSTKDEIDEFSSCEQKGQITFFDDGTLTTSQYDYEYTQNINGDCEKSSEGNGGWNLNENKLTLFIKYNNTGVEESDNLNATVYKLTDSTLQIGYFSDDPNDCSDGIKPSYYYTEYVREE